MAVVIVVQEEAGEFRPELKPEEVEDQKPSVAAE